MDERLKPFLEEIVTPNPRAGIILEQIACLQDRINEQLSIMESTATLIVALQYRRRVWEDERLAGICRRTRAQYTDYDDTLAAARAAFSSALTLSTDFVRTIQRMQNAYLRVVPEERPTRR